MMKLTGTFFDKSVLTYTSATNSAQIVSHHFFWILLKDLDPKSCRQISPTNSPTVSMSISLFLCVFLGALVVGHVSIATKRQVQSPIMNRKFFSQETMLAKSAMQKKRMAVWNLAATVTDIEKHRDCVGSHQIPCHVWMFFCCCRLANWYNLAEVENSTNDWNCTSALFGTVWYTHAFLH